MLKNEGCTFITGHPAAWKCPTETGWDTCQDALKHQVFQISFTCTDPPHHAKILKIESAIGCRRYVNRPGEYLCPSWGQVTECERVALVSNGLVKRCISGEKQDMDKLLASQGCKETVPGKYACTTQQGYGLCDRERSKGHALSCEPPGNQK